MVDMLGICSWNDVLSMQVWDADPLPQPGVLSLETERPPAVCNDWKDPAIPVISVLKLLAEGRWKRCKVSHDHTLTSDKEFHVDDPMERKAYLRCLLGWDTLVADGLTMLPGKSIATYYQCVLAAPKPAAVPIGCSGVDYLRLLNGLVDAADLVGRPVEPLPLAYEYGSDEEQPEPAVKKQRVKRAYVSIGDSADWGGDGGAHGGAQDS